MLAPAHTLAATTGAPPGGPGQLLLGLLPPLTLLALAGVIAARRPGAPARLRESLLLAAMGVGVWMVVGTELLSALRAITFRPVLMWWLVPAVVLGCRLIRIPRKNRASRVAPSPLGAYPSCQFYRLPAPGSFVGCA